MFRRHIKKLGSNQKEIGDAIKWNHVQNLYRCVKAGAARLKKKQKTNNVFVVIYFG